MLTPAGSLAPARASQGSLSTQALIDGLWVMGWPTSFIEGARPLAKGYKCAGRAVTLRFVPQRPDIAMDKPLGVNSPEYEASMLSCPSLSDWKFAIVTRAPPTVQSTIVKFILQPSERGISLRPMPMLLFCKPSGNATRCKCIL